jgi:hypothetical protein
VEDPTSEEVGAGAGANFGGDRDAKRAMKPAAGVVEARPGIIEDTHIDPLSETSNKGGPFDVLVLPRNVLKRHPIDDGWANATGTPGQTKTSETANAASSTLGSAANVATGAAKLAYGTVTGNATHVEEGKQAVYGKDS